MAGEKCSIIDTTEDRIGGKKQVGIRKHEVKFESISRTKIPEIIVSKIKEKIFSGELGVGSKLPGERESLRLVLAQAELQ